MKKIKTFIFITLILFLALLLVISVSRNVTTGLVVEDSPVLAYCPRIENYAFSLSEEKNYKLLRMSSSAEVLIALRAEKVENGLIRRVALENELLLDIKSELLEKGFVSIPIEHDAFLIKRVR